MRKKPFEIKVYKTIYNNAFGTLHDKYINNQFIIQDTSFMDPRNYQKIKQPKFIFPEKSMVKIVEIVGVDILIVQCQLVGFARNYDAIVNACLIQNYEEFRDIYLNEYRSREIQMQTWSQCLNVQKITHNTNYREHFAYWAMRFHHLEILNVSDEEIIRNIACHYPEYIRALLISLSKRTILAAMKRAPNKQPIKQFTNANT
ncbi:Hypothetical protein CINCED_3A005087 [Cinara cedri]|uniref:Uncharacterized protein n=1 Tax=Cinara cedri TaxID=506608 RepID=A0A5E4NL96_9HEMI|nr:Hypothetical protein CINCED_3A005087 [Cinara cedri]